VSGATASTARRPATALLSSRRCGERGTRSAFDQISISAGSPTCCGRTNPGTPGQRAAVLEHTRLDFWH